MPLEKLSAEDAVARASANMARIYPKESKGRERLTPFARPQTSAGFRFDKSSRIFAAGSCFARYIEKSLVAGGFNVTSSPEDIPLPQSAKSAAQLFHKYTIHSILNEIRWAKQGVDHGALLIDGPDGRKYDLQVSASMTGPEAEMLPFRRAFNASFAAAQTADVTVFTLGLVECWFDAELGVYLNTAPTKPLMRMYPGRFEFHLLDYNDILVALEDLHALLADGQAEPPKMLLTVSPVGLVSTFREHDVLVANCYSKSVQRAAVDAFCMSGRAHYFPSYEYVTLTDRRFAWSKHDFRHVRAETVDRIMADVLAAYVGPSEGQSLLDARGRATAHLDDGDPAQAAELIEAHLARYGETEDLLWILARSLHSLRRFEDTLATCRRIITLDGRLLQQAGRLGINTARQIGDTLAAEQIFAWYAARFPEDEGLDKLRPDFGADLDDGRDNDRDHIRQLYQNGAYAEAISYGTEALIRHGDDEELLWQVMRSYRALGRFDEALRACRRVMQIGGTRAQFAGKIGLRVAEQAEDPQAAAEIRAWYEDRFPEEGLV